MKIRFLICGISMLGSSISAFASCADFSGAYRRVDDQFTVRWTQHGCDSMTIEEFGWGTIVVQVDGTYRQISPEPAQKAFLFLDRKFVYSYIENDATRTMTIVYSRTAQGGIRGEVSRCDQSSCRQSVDSYDRL